MKGTKSRTPYDRETQYKFPFVNFPFLLPHLTKIRTLYASDLCLRYSHPNSTKSSSFSATFSRDLGFEIAGMEDNGGNKLNAIVRLKEIIQRWQYVTLGVKGNDDADETTGINPAISMRLKGYNVYSDSDVEDGCQTPDLPNDVPKGYLAVYVGPELRRFIIPTSYLSDPLFKILLEKVEEEFGFHHSGGLTIPCEIETFKYLLNCMEHHQQL